MENINKTSLGRLDGNYYNDKAFNLVFDLILKANPQINFTAEQVQFSEVKEDINLTQQTNTLGRLVGIPEMGREGEVLLLWNRVNLQDVFKYITPSVPYQPEAIMVSDYLPAFNKRWGFQLGSGDIYDQPVLTPTVPVEIKIRFREQNPAFINDFTLLIGTPAININRVVVNNRLDGLPGARTDGKLDAIYLNWMEDFTTLGEQLTAVTTGTPVAGELANFLISIMATDWVEDPIPAPFNYYRSMVGYNGTTQECPHRCNHLFDNVMVVKLNDEFCTNVAGFLLFHYNTLK